MGCANKIESISLAKCEAFFVSTARGHVKLSELTWVPSGSLVLNSCNADKSFLPGIKSDDPNLGILYQQMIQQFSAGLAALTDQGHAPVICGFAWMQGEQDSKNELGRFVCN